MGGGTGIGGRDGVHPDYEERLRDAQKRVVRASDEWIAAKGSTNTVVEYGLAFDELQHLIGSEVRFRWHLYPEANAKRLAAIEPKVYDGSVIRFDTFQHELNKALIAKQVELGLSPGGPNLFPGTASAIAVEVLSRLGFQEIS